MTRPLIAHLALALLLSTGCPRPPELPDAGAPDSGAADASVADAGAPDAGPPVTSVSAFWPRYAQAYCEWQQRCDIMSATSLTECVQFYSGTFVSLGALPGASVDAGLQTFDPAAAMTCLEGLATAGCDVGSYGGNLSSLFGRSVAPGCADVTHGTLATGGRCFSDGDCTAGRCGAKLGAGTCPSTCVAFADPGQSCANTDCDPRQALQCDFVTSLCEAVPARAAVNQPCGRHGTTGIFITCAAGLYCTGSSDATAVCAPLGGPGASCSYGTFTCAPPLVCTGVDPNATCQPASAAGEPCITPDGGLISSGCEYALACEHGLCTAPPASGPCGPDPRRPCDVVHVCDWQTHVCLPRAANAEACVNDLQCYDGFCDGGTCAIAGCVP